MGSTSWAGLPITQTHNRFTRRGTHTTLIQILLGIQLLLNFKAVLRKKVRMVSILKRIRKSSLSGSLSSSAPRHEKLLEDSGPGEIDPLVEGVQFKVKYLGTCPPPMLASPSSARVLLPQPFLIGTR